MTAAARSWPVDMLRTRMPKIVVLALLVAVGVGMRAYGLGAAGLSEDEVNKVEAARAYLHGDVSQNREHPMLMKLAIAGCLATTDEWNRQVSSLAQIPEEVPVRLPNVLFGALTTFVLFLVGKQFFGTSVGLVAAVLWATGVSAITINRIAKEDTFLVFFYWLCLYFYERAKRFGSDHVMSQSRLFGLAGASLGLMLASKYFPHYWGLLFIFYHLVGQNATNQPLTRRDFVYFYGGFALLFLLFNPTVLLPSTLQYFIAYTDEETVTHHGYVLMGTLYANNFSATPQGLPLYFYPLLLVLKTPIPVLVAFLIGFGITIRRRGERGYCLLVFLFVLWMVPYSIFAAKWLRYILSLLPVVYLCAAIGVVETYRYFARRWSLPHLGWPRVALATAMFVLFVAIPAVSAAASAPFYSLYLNPLGMGRTGYYFPHDEFYDAGLREAIERICTHAPEGAVVYGEAPSVFRYYKHRFGRDDIRFFQLSQRSTAGVRPAPSFVVVQDGRRYFENVAYVADLESRHRPIDTIRIAGVDAVRIYCLSDTLDPDWSR